MLTKTDLKEYSTLIIPLVGFVVLIFLIIAYLIPRGLALKKQADKLDKYKLEVGQLSTKLEILEQFNQSDLVGFVDKSRIILPEDDYLSGIVVGIQLSAQEAGVAASNFTINPGKSITGVNLSATGDIEGVLKFIDLYFKNNKQIVSLKNVAIEKDEKEEGEGLLTANIELDAHYQPFIKSIGKVEDELFALSDKQREMLNELLAIKEPIAEDKSETESAKEKLDPFF